MDTIIAFHLAWIGFGMILMVYAVFSVAKEVRRVGEIAENIAAMTREILNRVITERIQPAEPQPG